MKIKVQVDLNNKEKASMIGNKIPIPNSFVEFEMSPENAILFGDGDSTNNSLYVTNDCIEVSRFVVPHFTVPQYIDNGLDHKDGRIVSWNYSVGKSQGLEALLNTDMVSGILQAGMNIDSYLIQLINIQNENKRLAQQVKDQVADFPNHAPQRAAAKAAYEEAENKKMNESIEASKKEREIKEAADKKLSDERKAVHEKRVAWAAEHGSERLKKGLDQGYRCIKLYEREFGEHILGSDYTWDREDVVTEKDHACPSMEALNICEALEENDKVVADIKWLPKGLDELNTSDERQYEEQSSGCEAVSVKVIGITGTWYKVM